jgi:hypothetical protein
VNAVLICSNIPGYSNFNFALSLPSYHYAVIKLNTVVTSWLEMHDTAKCHKFLSIWVKCHSIFHLGLFLTTEVFPQPFRFSWSHTIDTYGRTPLDEWPARRRGIKIYTIVILPAVLYERETWSLTLKEEHMLEAKTAFWCVAPCSLVEVGWLFRGAFSGYALWYGGLYDPLCSPI